MVVMITTEEYRDLVIKANKYDELQKTNKENKSAEINETAIEIGKIEGVNAEKFIEFIEKITGEVVADGSKK